MPPRVRAAVDPAFAAELRRLRDARGLSLRALGNLVYQSKSLVHKLENRESTPTPELAQRLDDALQADGKLAKMVHPGPVIDPDNAERLSYTVAHPHRADRAAADALAQVLAGQRQLEDAIGAAAVFGAARAQAELAAALADQAAERHRATLVDVAGQWAQFLGWLCTAVGDYRAGRAWLAQGLECAVEVDNRDLAASVLSFQGYLAEETGRLPAAVGLSRASRRDPGVYAGLRAYCAGQEAASLAMLGTRPSEVLSLLDESADLAGEQDQDTLPPWGYWYSPAFFQVQRGTVLRHLGVEHREYNGPAVEALTAGVEGLPAEVHGSDWFGRYLVNLGIAHGQDGDGSAAAGALRRARQIGDATRSVALVGEVDAAARRLGVSMDT